MIERSEVGTTTIAPPAKPKRLSQTPAERLSQIATSHEKDVQTMADAALIFALLHGARLDPLILNLIGRLDELEGEAFTTLVDGVVSEGNRRRKSAG